MPSPSAKPSRRAARDDGGRPDRKSRENRPDRPGLRFLRILVILIVFGLVVPRLLGAITDYLFSGAEPGSPVDSQAVTSQTVVTERTIYHGWLSDFLLWWQSMQRNRE